MARLIVKVKEKKNGVSVDMITKDMTKGTEMEKKTVLHFLTILNDVMERAKQPQLPK